MFSWRKTAGLGLILLLLGGVWWWQDGQTDSGRPSATTALPVAMAPNAASEPLLGEMTLAQVSEVRLTEVATGKVLLLKQEGLDRWRQVSPRPLRVGEVVREPLGFILANDVPLQLIETTAAELATFGLDPARYELVITNLNGKSWRLWLGNETATGGNLYVRGEKGGDTAVAVVPQTGYLDLWRLAAGD